MNKSHFNSNPKALSVLCTQIRHVPISEQARKEWQALLNSLQEPAKGWKSLSVGKSWKSLQSLILEGQSNAVVLTILQKDQLFNPGANKKLKMMKALWICDLGVRIPNRGRESSRSRSSLPESPGGSPASVSQSVPELKALSQPSNYKHRAQSVRLFLQPLHFTKA